MYSVITEPENTSLHSREYQRLIKWFQRRQHELGLDQLHDGDPMDPHHPYNQAFDVLCKEGSSSGVVNEIIGISLQLSHAFFQMKDPIQQDEFTA